MDAAHEAVLPKFKKFWDSRQWRDGKSASGLSLNLEPDTCPKLALLRYYRSTEEAAAGAESMRAAWKIDAEKAAEKAAAKWSQRLRKAIPESAAKQAVIFGTVALVALGGVGAAHRRLQHRGEAHSGQGR